MRVTRVYTPDLLAPDSTVVLSAMPSSHLIKVMRLRSGAKAVLFNGDGAESGFFLDQQATLTLEIGLHSPDGRAPVVLVGIVRADGTPVYGVTTDIDKIEPARVLNHEFHISMHYPELPLLPGVYALRVHALDPEGVRLFDTVTRDFTVRGESREFGLVRIAHHWQLPAKRALAYTEIE